MVGQPIGGSRGFENMAGLEVWGIPIPDLDLDLDLERECETHESITRSKKNYCSCIQTTKKWFNWLSSIVGREKLSRILREGGGKDISECSKRPQTTQNLEYNYWRRDPADRDPHLPPIPKSSPDF
jgi:hypothetical protein